MTAHCGFVSFTLSRAPLSRLCVFPWDASGDPAAANPHVWPVTVSVIQTDSCPGSAAPALQCLLTVTLNIPFNFFAQHVSLLAMGVGDGILKSRDITLPTKVCLVQVMVFPVVTCGCGSWTIKKAECRRIDAFELWCWRRLLGVPWTARRSNQSILKEISPEYSSEGLMLRLKL